MNQTINDSQKICPVCQAICNQSVNYCTRCGTKFEQNTTTLDTDDKTSLKLVKKHKTKKIVGVIAFSLLAICFLFATIMFAMDLLSQNTIDCLISKLGVSFYVLAEIGSVVGIVSCIKENKKIPIVSIIIILLSIVSFFVVGVFTIEDRTTDSTQLSSFKDYNLPTKDYSIQNNAWIIGVSVPNTWIPTNHSSSIFFELTEYANSQNFAIIDIKTEDLVLDKETLENKVESFLSSDEYTMISNSWREWGETEFFDVYYQKNTNTKCFCRQIIFLLEDQKSYFSISVSSEEKDDLDYAECVLASAIKKEQLSTVDTTETTNKLDENLVEKTFNKVINLTKYDLDGSEGNWSYNGISLTTEDCEWIDNSANSKGTVNQGALYRKMAMCLEGFKIGNNYENYAKDIIGFTPSTRDEFQTYYSGLKEFICVDDSFKSIIKALDNLDCTKGSFDYNYKSLGKYDFEISDVNKCAEELKISKEMFAYILAMLTEYGADVTFDGNSCHIKYTNYQ